MHRKLRLSVSASKPSKNVASPTPAPAWLDDALRDAPPIMTLREVASLVKLSTRHLRRQIALGRLTTLRLGNEDTAIRVARADVAQFLLSMAGGAS